jgi:hypothetical protein
MVQISSVQSTYELRSNPVVEEASLKTELPSNSESRAEQVENVAREVISAVSNVSDVYTSSVDLVDNPSPEIQKSCTIGGFLTLVNFPFFVKDAYQDAKEMVCGRKLKDRALAGFHTVLNANALVGTVSSTMNIFETFQVISKEATAWTSVLGYVSFGLSFVSLGLESYSLHESVQFSKKIQHSLDRMKSAKVEQKSGEAIRALSEIEKNIGSCSCELILSDGGRDTLLHRARNIQGMFRKGLDDRAVASTKELLEKIKSRAKIEFGFKIYNLILRIIGIVTLDFSLFVPPLAIVTASIGLCVACISLLSWAGKKLFVNRDPFNPQGESLAEKVYHRIRELFSTKAKVQPQLVTVL